MDSRAEQIRLTDSLKAELLKATHDTTKSTLLGYIVETAPDGIWEKYNTELLNLCEKNLAKTLSKREQSLFYLKYADALNNVGLIEQNSGNYIKQLQYYEKSLKMKEQIGDNKGIAATLLNIGLAYKNYGDITKAIEYFYKSAAMHEKVNDNRRATVCYNSIANIYSAQGEKDEAFKLLRKSLEILEKIKDKKGIAGTLSCIGDLYKEKKDFDKALGLYKQALQLQEEMGERKEYAATLGDLGSLYLKMGDTIARQYYLKSLEIQEEVNDKRGIAITLNDLANFYCSVHRFPLAISNASRSLQLSKELGFPANIRSASKRLYDIYKHTGDHKNALKHYELYIQMRDSVSNESTRKASVKSQLKYEYEKQAAADSVAHAKESEIKNVQLQKQTAEIKAKKNQQYALFGGLGLVIIFAGFMFNRFKITQKQKSIIEEQKKLVEEQKHLVEEKQKEVMDSIRYAQRIQKAQLPSEKKIIKSLERLMKL